MGRRKIRLLGVAAFVAVFLLFRFLRTGGQETFSFELSPSSDIENHVNVPNPSSPLFSAPPPLAAARASNSEQTSIQNSNALPSDNTRVPPTSNQIYLQHHNNTTFAISTTVLNPPPTFPIWLAYHLRRVDLVIIFLDDPSERPRIESLVHGKPVVLFDGSMASPDMSPASRLIVRQDINNDAAIAYALANNITWLLHIDIDELFYEDGDSSWKTMENVGVISFVNHEAVPLSYPALNWFEECTLFKINGGNIHFMAYVNGKSAVRVTQGVQSSGPHNFWGYQGEYVNVTRPMILHYPTPSFESWVAKYKFYGEFSDYWFDDPDQPNTVSFMLESRDQLRAALASGNWEEARNFYNSMIPENATHEHYLSTGDLRIFKPLADN
jgi:hypothetical protein